MSTERIEAATIKLENAATTADEAVERGNLSIIRTQMTSVSVTADKTLVTTDDYTTQVVDATAVTTITIPHSTAVTFELDTRVNIYQANTGGAVVAAESGVTIENTADNSTAGQGATITLWQRALNVWVIDGKRSAQVQSGIVQYYPATEAPAGWLKADGAEISRVTYANLFAVIGETYGNGDGSTTFLLPDLRGEFLRGLDDGRGVDTGRLIGTAQDDEIESHDHYVFADATSGSTPSTDDHATEIRTSVGDNSYSINYRDIDPTLGLTNQTGGTETRPRNVAMLAIIKT